MPRLLFTRAPAPIRACISAYVAEVLGWRRVSRDDGLVEVVGEHLSIGAGRHRRDRAEKREWGVSGSSALSFAGGRCPLGHVAHERRVHAAPSWQPRLGDAVGTGHAAGRRASWVLVSPCATHLHRTGCRAVGDGRERREHENFRPHSTQHTNRALTPTPRPLTRST